VEWIAGHRNAAVSLGYVLPSDALRPYITTYYLTEIAAEAEPVSDMLHPEGGNIRLTLDGSMSGSIGPGELAPMPNFAGIGPTSMGAPFTLAPGRYWGIGLLPLGWARFVDAPAASRADSIADAHSDAAYAAFGPLPALMAPLAGDCEAEIAVIDAHMLKLLAQRPALDEERIMAAHTALIDPEVHTVGQLTERVGISIRSLERMAAAVFGFQPKLLLRRQRFLRSLAQFMLDPSLAWLETLDWQYYDQAHFIRDFRRFMGTTPSAYAREPHPIMLAAAHVRSRAAGKAMQVLHDPADDAGGADPLR
jgi:AraC-like DNA-binding protein